MLKLLWIRPCLHYTLPNFAFDAMLKLTGIEIDLMNDQEMYEMIKSGRRGEMTQTNCKKVEANDKGYKDMELIVTKIKTAVI